MYMNPMILQLVMFSNPKSIVLSKRGMEYNLTCMKDIGSSCITFKSDCLLPIVVRDLESICSNIIIN